MAPEAITSGAWIKVCQTKRKDIRRPHFWGPYASRKKTKLPPATGRAAPNSSPPKPSSNASTAPAVQASKAWGPPMARMTSGLTTKGPMPIMSIMFRATASFRPKPRTRPGSCCVALRGDELVFVLAPVAGPGYCGGVIGPQRIANGQHDSYDQTSDCEDWQRGGGR